MAALTVPDAAAGQVCRVCGAPAARGWPDGWYCDNPACIAQRTWGSGLDPDRPRPDGAYCAPARCYCGRCPHYRLPDQLARAGAVRPADGPAGPAPSGDTSGRLAARVMAAAAAARAAGAVLPSVEVEDVTAPRVQVAGDARATSIAAAAAVLPRTGTQRRAVLDAVLDAHARGHGGATDPELQRHLGLSPNSERPRRGELVDAGWLHDSGRTRDHGGRAHVVWAPTPAALHHRADSGP